MDDIFKLVKIGFKIEFYESNTFLWVLFEFKENIERKKKI